MFDWKRVEWTLLYFKHISENVPHVPQVNFYQLNLCIILKGGERSCMDAISEDWYFFDVYIVFICDVVLRLLEWCGSLEYVYMFFQCCIYEFVKTNNFKFYEYVFCKPLRDLTHSLEITFGLKGLIIHAKCNCDSYESELRFYFLFSWIFDFVLLEHEKNLGVEVLFNPILCHFMPLLSNICSE